MGGILKDFFVEVIEEWISEYNMILANAIRDMLYVENLMKEIFTEQTIENLYEFIYFFGVSLVILKFLKKGFSVYILWRDGDADSSIGDMLTGTLQAAIVMISFPYLYDILADVVMWFGNGILGVFSFENSGSEFVINQVLSLILSFGLLQVIVLLLYFIFFTVLWIKLIARGIELLILRLGIPIACLGLIDSDGGMFKPYMLTMYKTMFTSILQVVLMSLSLRCMLTMGFFYMLLAIGILTAAFNTPTLLQSFLISTGGAGNITNKIYTSARLMQMAKGMVRK
jgi:hypothetical protein